MYDAIPGSATIYGGLWPSGQAGPLRWEKILKNFSVRKREVTPSGTPGSDLKGTAQVCLEMSCRRHTDASNADRYAGGVSLT